MRVWLQDGKESVGATLRNGDKVLIYEGKKGPARFVTGASGVRRKVASATGRQGIICIAEAAGPFGKDPTFEVFEYGDGIKRWWCWHAPLTLLRSDGYVPLSEVNRVLDYKPGCVLRGFGSKSSGLKEISQAQFEAFEKLF